MRWGSLAAALAALAPGAALAATPFDGAWTVAQTCPATGQDVRGFYWVYGANVQDGQFAGTHTPSGPSDGLLRLVGQIAADGTALLEATGQTGRSEYSLGHVAQGYPVHYRVMARFTPNRGSGSRTEQRPCDFSFTRN